MVRYITSLTGNGLKDWFIQRITAVYFGLYSLYLLIYLVLHPYLTFTEWHRLFVCPFFKVATVLALFSFVLHAWIGLWTVTTDYIKCSCMRVTTQLFILIVLLSQLIWGFMILWGQ